MNARLSEYTHKHTENIPCILNKFDRERINKTPTNQIIQDTVVPPVFMCVGTTFILRKSTINELLFAGARATHLMCSMPNIERYMELVMWMELLQLHFE